MKRHIALQIEKNRAHGRALLEGVADYALQHTDWRLELVDPAKLSSVAYVRQFDGLIVRVMDDATADVLLRADRPVVDTYGRMDGNPLPSIRLDDAALARMAFACFAERHYHSFAYCGFPGLRFSDARGEAFGRCAAASFPAASGQPINRRSPPQGARHKARLGVHSFSAYRGSPRSRIADKFFRDEKTSVPDADALGRWLVSLPKPVALFCCNDLRAVQVLNVCADRGIAVPGEVAVMGVDNDILLCTFTKPALSSIDTDSVSLGRKAAGMLQELMQSKASRPARTVPPLCVQHPPRRVIERLSTDAYPFKAPWLEEAVRYIRQHLATGASAGDVVSHIGYSHPTVNRAFVDELGHTVKREILVQRGNLACSLLRETDCTLAEISRRCGYQTAQYFSHCFAAEFGMTPDAWRKRFKNCNRFFRNCNLHAQGKGIQ